MRYSDFSIEMLLERLLTRSMATSTPKKYSTVMFEAWEAIRQLQRDLASTQQKLDALRASNQSLPSHRSEENPILDSPSEPLNTN